MRYVSDSPMPTNVQDSRRITFSEGFNTCFTGLSSTTIVFSIEYLPPKPENKYFWMVFKNNSFLVPFTFMYNTFPRPSWTLIWSQDSWPRIFIGFTGKPSNRFDSGYSHRALDSDICHIAKFYKEPFTGQAKINNNRESYKNITILLCLKDKVRGLFVM
jgi:hypothetical protein